MLVKSTQTAQMFADAAFRHALHASGCIACYCTLFYCTVVMSEFSTCTIAACANAGLTFLSGCCGVHAHFSACFFVGLSCLDDFISMIPGVLSHQEPPGHKRSVGAEGAPILDDLMLGCAH